MTPSSGLPYLQLVVNPLDRIGALVRQNIDPQYLASRDEPHPPPRPIPSDVEFAQFPSMRIHQTLVAELELQQNDTSLEDNSWQYDVVRELLYQTFGQRRNPNLRPTILSSIQPEPVTLAPPPHDELPPIMNLELTYCKVIDLYHDVLLRGSTVPSGIV